MVRFHHVVVGSMIVLACATGVARADHAADLAFAVQELNGDKTSGWIVEKLVTFRLGDKCWDKVLDKKHTALARIAGNARKIERYAEVMTEDKWSHVENQGANNKESNRAIVEKMIEDFKPKFHVTVVVEGDDCEPSGDGLWLKYLGEVLGDLATYPPKSGKATVTIKAVARAKAVKTEVSKDGSTFTITGPRDVEVSGWPSSVEKPIKRVSSKN